MIKLQIVEYPNTILRQVSIPITVVNQDIRDLAQTMLELLEASGGVALSAIQVGIECRMFVILPRDDDETVFINPVISRRRGHKIDEEGCLSFPGEFKKVSRATKLELNAYNLDGEEISLNLEGLDARIVQHELDHMNGILFIDKEIQNV